MENLAGLRDQLKDLTEKHFLIIKNRKELVTKIQNTKSKNKLFFAFDPIQEKKLFESQKDNLINLSIRELLAYSLILEEHASVEEKAYPQWSKGEHLTDHNQGLLACINPILLAVIHKDKYDELPLSEQFKTILESHVR